MNSFSKIIVDALTGETTVVPFTEQETAAHLAEQQKIADAEALAIADEQAKIEAKAATEAKLAALGLTTEDLKVLGL